MLFYDPHVAYFVVYNFLVNRSYSCWIGQELFSQNILQHTKSIVFDFKDTWKECLYLLDKVDFWWILSNKWLTCRRKKSNIAYMVKC